MQKQTGHEGSLGYAAILPTTPGDCNDTDTVLSVATE
jgi:hypothetical protein